MCASLRKALLSLKELISKFGSSVTLALLPGVESDGGWVGRSQGL